jgi:UPF0716 family protein affecting phage T7 exclusion
MPVVVALIAMLITPGFISRLTLILITLPCLFGLLTTRWRISVLRNRAFTPFCRWLAQFIQPWR